MGHKNDANNHAKTFLTNVTWCTRDMHYKWVGPLSLRGSLVQEIIGRLRCIIEWVMSVAFVQEGCR